VYGCPSCTLLNLNSITANMGPQAFKFAVGHFCNILYMEGVKNIKQRNIISKNTCSALHEIALPKTDHHQNHQSNEHAHSSLMNFSSILF